MDTYTVYDISMECGAFHDLYNTVIIGDHIPPYTLHNHIMALGAYDHRCHMILRSYDTHHGLGTYDLRIICP